MEFHISAPEQDLAPERIVAVIDVVSSYGTEIRSIGIVTYRDLQRGGPIGLDFYLAEPADTLEYRLRSANVAELFVADAPNVIVRDGAPPTSVGSTDLSEQQIAILADLQGMCFEDVLQLGLSRASDPDDVADDMREAFAHLRPYKALGFEKARFGSQGDGGYVCLDDFAGIDAVLSLGINDNADFDIAVADLGATVYQFDHTVSAPRPDDARMIFEPKMITAVPGPGCETLPALIRRLDRGEEQRNIFLKIDIENWEWPVFDDIDPALLDRVRQITGEFHAFDFFVYPQWRARTMRALEKLSSQFALIHVHGNNWAATTSIGGQVLPNVMEMTFVNRACYRLVESEETFPTPLDIACRPNHPDIELGRFVLT